MLVTRREPEHERETHGRADRHDRPPDWPSRGPPWYIMAASAGVWSSAVKQAGIRSARAAERPGAARRNPGARRGAIERDRSDRAASRPQANGAMAARHPPATRSRAGPVVAAESGTPRGWRSRRADPRYLDDSSSPPRVHRRLEFPRTRRSSWLMMMSRIERSHKGLSQVLRRQRLEQRLDIDVAAADDHARPAAPGRRAGRSRAARPGRRWTAR